MGQTSYREGFQEGADNYEIITSRKHISHIYTLEQEVLSDFFRAHGTERQHVLDFACGTGRWTMFLEKHFVDVVGLDISAKMVELAKQKCPRTTFIVGDITSPQGNEILNNEQFDVITAFRFFKNAEKDLRGAATAILEQHLKPGGYFIFDLHLNTHSIMGLLASFMRISGLYKLFHLNKLSVTTISIHEIMNLFKNTQFKIVDYYGMGVIPGRRNLTLLPASRLLAYERWLTRKKKLRRLSYNLLVIAQKKQG